MGSGSSRRRAGVALAVCVALSSALILPSASAAATQAEDAEKAAIISVAARHALDKGDYKLAARLYDEAFGADPATPGYLYSAARARQRGGDIAGAEQQFNQFLKIAPKSPLAEKVRRRLLEIQSARDKQALESRLAAAEAARKAAEGRLAAERKAEAARKVAQPAAVTTVSAQVRHGGAAGGVESDLLGWSMVGGGVVLGAVSMVVLVMANSDLAELQSRLPDDDGNPPEGVAMIGFQDARTSAGSIQNAWLVSGLLGGVAAATTTFGVYRLLTHDASQVVLLPGPGARSLAVHWRF